MTPAVVFIRWRDSLIGESGWLDSAEAQEQARQMYDATLSAAGFLVADEKTHVLIATGHNPNTDEVQGGLMIPRSEVVELITLREAK